MQAGGGVWGYEEINSLITNPQAYIPLTDMWIAGLPKPEVRAALLAYLRTISENPPPLP